MLFLTHKLVIKAIRFDVLFVAIRLIDRVPDGLLFSISGFSAEVNVAQCFKSDFARQILYCSLGLGGRKLVCWRCPSDCPLTPPTPYSLASGLVCWLEGCLWTNQAGTSGSSYSYSLITILVFNLKISNYYHY